MEQSCPSNLSWCDFFFWSHILVFIFFCRRPSERSRKKFTPFLSKLNVILIYSITEIISNIMYTVLGSCMTNKRVACSIFQSWSLSFPCMFDACSVIVNSKNVLPILCDRSCSIVLRHSYSSHNWFCVIKRLPVLISRIKTKTYFSVSILSLEVFYRLLQLFLKVWM